MSRLRAFAPETSSGISGILPPEEARVVDEMLGYYTDVRVGELGHEKKSVDRSLAHIRDLVAFTGKAPWNWDEDDYLAWCKDGRSTDRRPKALGRSTMRDRQISVRRFLGYIEKNPKFATVVAERFGGSVRQIVHEWNSVRHTTDQAGEKERTCLPPWETDGLFESILRSINWAMCENPKGVMPLKRDYALIYLTYSWALRISEVAALNTISFLPNPDVPLFGEFGLASVLGKGSNGSGKKRRKVPTTDVKVAEIMEWYLRDVRPHFLKNANPSEKALFLSERGKRISVSAIAIRFKLALENAGLHDKGYTPHSFRRSNITDEQYTYSQEFVRAKAGHVHLSTTQKYSFTPDSFVQDELVRVTDNQLRNRISGEEDDDE